MRIGAQLQVAPAALARGAKPGVRFPLAERRDDRTSHAWRQQQRGDRGQQPGPSGRIGGDRHQGPEKLRPAATAGHQRCRLGAKRRGPKTTLPPLKGDHLSAAAGINDNGDVVGCSGTCETPDTSALCRHAVLWRNGAVFDLGGLGGAINNYPVVINNAGQIAGISGPPGDATTYAVLWQNGAITNLGALPGDVLSVTQDMNAKGQVVGSSCDASFNCRAFLWDKGVMIDLNSLVPPDSPLYLTYAEGINDRGEISGNAVLKSNPNDLRAFLAIPAPAAQIAGDSAPKITLPANIRASLQRRLRLRHFGDRPTAQQ